jgi:hypothetical protein
MYNPKPRPAPPRPGPPLPQVLYNATDPEGRTLQPILLLGIAKAARERAQLPVSIHRHHHHQIDHCGRTAAECRVGAPGAWTRGCVRER